MAEILYFHKLPLKLYNTEKLLSQFFQGLEFKSSKIIKTYFFTHSLSF